MFSASESDKDQCGQECGDLDEVDMRLPKRVPLTRKQPTTERKPSLAESASYWTQYLKSMAKRYILSLETRILLIET